MSASDPHTRSFEASAAVLGRRFAAGVGAGVGAKVRQAAAATDAIAGVTERMGASAAGDMLDVVVGGYAEITAGANIAAFDKLTADAQGRAVKAVPVAGSTVHVGAVAQSDAVAGDVIWVLLAPSLLHTPA